ncbi:hypothetical protein FN846DRAFT_909414 [Sphaerosporella brunnea]|uniref:Uncharacterized protein n=1 Tax=Sphaerosporella brunnea TaxID=1250544 RepID=A0A5J5ERY8_9PEZI|nr:hypothetical protein FN846DRAFT_909414 [Sphaerosporella brunnea]
MNDDCIDDEAWPVIAFSWPYYMGKFTVIGAPKFSESLITVKFKRKRLAIKFAVPRPHNLTVKELVRILVGYLGQLQTTHGLAALGLLPWDIQTLSIEGAISGERVERVLDRVCQACPKTPTLFAVSQVPPADHDNEKPARTFIAVQTQWIKFPDIREPRQEPQAILMDSTTTIAEVRSFVATRAYEALSDHDECNGKMSFENNMVVRIDDGHWTKVPDPHNTTLGSLQRPAWYDLGLNDAA